MMPQSRGPWDKLQLVSGGIPEASGQTESLSHPGAQAVAPETEALRDTKGLSPSLHVRFLRLHPQQDALSVTYAPGFDVGSYRACREQALNNLRDELRAARPLDAIG